ncbi:hypothetical protein FA09DRAFT_358894 [Tilletiopsis washingtonensis]|uniref:Uncharacterized protein n=1 Tax=Tilletiopsis washingtonensis TaxID=58919 RepID=A0A316ZFY3_9BASI|nr:hypothetical protein FA09DRAFT_358894 [Tilletiopsis washingtonensis]PWO00147.1 hypothetical protein FA09DRAFT_358894 [Tilletiopsis washingtonensis]
MTPVTPATPATPAARATAPTNVEADDTFEEIDMKSAPMVELVEFIVTISAAVLKSIQRLEVKTAGKTTMDVEEMIETVMENPKWQIKCLDLMNDINRDSPRWVSLELRVALARGVAPLLMMEPKKSDDEIVRVMNGFISLLKHQPAGCGFDKDKYFYDYVDGEIARVASAAPKTSATPPNKPEKEWYFDAYGLEASAGAADDESSEEEEQDAADDSEMAADIAEWRKKVDEMILLRKLDWTHM